MTLLARKLRAIRQHGSEVKYHHETVGANFRLDALQAAVLRVKLPHLRGMDGRAAAQRRAISRRCSRSAGLTSTVRLPLRAAERTHIYNQFVIRVPERDQLRAYLQTQGIGTEVYYPMPLHLQPCFRDLGYAAGSFPVAEAAAREVLALPIYGELSEAQQAWVVEAIRLFFQQRA